MRRKIRCDREFCKVLKFWRQLNRANSFTVSLTLNGQNMIFAASDICTTMETMRVFPTFDNELSRSHRNVPVLPNWVFRAAHHTASLGSAPSPSAISMHTATVWDTYPQIEGQKLKNDTLCFPSVLGFVSFFRFSLLAFRLQPQIGALHFLSN